MSSKESTLEIIVEGAFIDREQVNRVIGDISGLEILKTETIIDFQSVRAVPDEAEPTKGVGLSVISAIKVLAQVVGSSKTIVEGLYSALKGKLSGASITIKHEGYEVSVTNANREQLITILNMLLEEMGKKTETIKS